jgi:enoyl-CoA hydratase/carnithine racemase
MVELNRPKQMNALSLDMCTQIKSLLLDKINVPNTDVGAFVVKGAGGKAFCAGGDVKAIWQELQGADKELPLNVVGSGKPGYLHSDFFRQEYIMNYLLGTSLVPQVSFWDGIVMGGGVGVSVLGEFRVATEKSLFAMPETAIGLFPDVGSSAWLPHLPEGMGAFIGKLFLCDYRCIL